MLGLVTIFCFCAGLGMLIVAAVESSASAEARVRESRGTKVKFVLGVSLLFASLYPLVRWLYSHL